MIVLKFGGSSVGDGNKITNICDIIKSRLAQKPIVVVSAVERITNMLIHIAEKAADKNNVDAELKEIKQIHYDILKKLKLKVDLVDNELKELYRAVDKIFAIRRVNPELMDEIQSFGERMSAKIVAANLNKIGIKSQDYSAWDIGMITTPDYGSAEPLPDTEEKIYNAIKKINVVPVITGFIGKDSAGNITTLGRGGSDYTASIIGAAINSPVEIWTDVNGIMTANPKIVKEAKTIEQISFNEAAELAYFGAKVLHPKTIWPAVRKNIPVKILNSFQPEHKGTTILKEEEKIKEASKEIIKAIACKKNVYLITIISTRMLLAHGFLARLFSVFEDYKKSVDMVATSEVSVSITLDDGKNLDKIKSDLEEIAEVNIEQDKSIICVVGRGMMKIPGIAGRTFSVLGKNKINIEMISQGASEMNISFIVDNNDADRAVQLLHKEYFG